MPKHRVHEAEQRTERNDREQRDQRTRKHRERRRRITPAMTASGAHHCSPKPPRPARDLIAVEKFGERRELPQRREANEDEHDRGDLAPRRTDCSTIENRLHRPALKSFTRSASATGFSGSATLIMLSTASETCDGGTSGLQRAVLASQCFDRRRTASRLPRRRPAPAAAQRQGARRAVATAGCGSRSARLRDRRFDRQIAFRIETHRAIREIRRADAQRCRRRR